MVLITAWAGVLHIGRDYGALAVIVRAATRICDLNVTSAVGSRRRVTLPIGAKRNDLGTYWASKH